jgi:hypothetical protein
MAERCADVRWARDARVADAAQPNRRNADGHRHGDDPPHADGYAPDFHAGGGTATTTLRPSGSALKARAIERRGKNDDFRSGTGTARRTNRACAPT